MAATARDAALRDANVLLRSPVVATALSFARVPATMRASRLSGGGRIAQLLPKCSPVRAGRGLTPISLADPE